MSRHDPHVSLRHMLDYAREAIGFVADRAREDLATDRMLCLALVRAIEVVGEAATRVPADFRTRHPQVPWTGITGFRNRMIHGYDQVDLNLVWAVAKDDLPPLVTELESILVESSECIGDKSLPEST